MWGVTAIDTHPGVSTEWRMCVGLIHQVEKITKKSKRRQQYMEFTNSIEYSIYKAVMSLSSKYWDCKDNRQTWENLDNDIDKIIRRYKDKDEFRFVRAQLNTTRTNIKRHLEYNSRFDGMETDLI